MRVGSHWPDARQVRLELQKNSAELSEVLAEAGRLEESWLIRCRCLSQPRAGLFGAFGHVFGHEKQVGRLRSSKDAWAPHMAALLSMALRRPGGRWPSCMCAWMPSDTWMASNIRPHHGMPRKTFLINYILDYVHIYIYWI